VRSAGRVGRSRSGAEREPVFPTLLDGVCPRTGIGRTRGSSRLPIKGGKRLVDGGPKVFEFVLELQFLSFEFLDPEVIG
jgi:hypothetical protein